MTESRARADAKHLPMRVALSAPDVNTVGGIERIIVETANWLSRTGNDVTVYAARTDRDVLDDGVRVREIHVPARLDTLGLGFRRRARAAIEADRPDVHGAFSALSPLGGVFWIPSVHRVAYDLLLEWRTPIRRIPVQINPFHRVRLGLERSMFATGGYTHLLAFAEGTKSDVMRLYGVPGSDIDVLPVGFDPVAFDPNRKATTRTESRARLGYGPEDRVILFVANELERKGFGVLLDAVAQIGDPAIKILGAGRVRPNAYRQELERLDLTDRLQWVGSSDDVGSLHAASDVFALPTRYEAWGLVIVEALASGLPVVTSRLAGAAITVSDRDTGWLLDDPEDPVELAQALRWALSDAPTGAQEVAASVASYRWSEIVARYEKVLRTAAEPLSRERSREHTPSPEAR
jgi:UDP-glucose:(heptosyl)LPS alpha-1,3-glucosyltransferase